TKPAAARAERERPDWEPSLANALGLAVLVFVVIGFFVARSLTKKPAQNAPERTTSVGSLSRPGVPAETARSSGTAEVPLGSPARISRGNPKDGLGYVWIPPGTFTMGCSTGETECNRPDEKPAHEVTITKGFWLGQTPVTQAAYQRVVGSN